MYREDGQKNNSSTKTPRKPDSQMLKCALELNGWESDDYCTPKSQHDLLH